MSNGTLAEKRTLIKKTTEVVPPVETPPELKPAVVKVVQEETPTLTLEVPEIPTKEPKDREEQAPKCTYCKVDRIITLSIRGSITLVLLALCFNLIKSATK